MATIKRKRVSTKAVSGQKKAGSILHNKLFWIIASIVAVILIAGGVILGVVLYKHSQQDDDETPDYMAETWPYTIADGTTVDVNFTKMSYNGVLMHLNPDDYDDGTYQAHIFYAAFDLTSFYPDPAIDDGKDEDDGDVFVYSEDDKKVLNALMSVQYAIDKYNEANPEDKAVLYIIDTSCGSNSSALCSSYFGTEAVESATFCFGYIAGEDGAKTEYQINEKKDGEYKTNNLLATDKNTMYTTVAANVRTFINTYSMVTKIED